MFERELRDLAHVPRWGIIRITKQQSVAEHSFYTAVYALQIADLIGSGCDRGKLAQTALWHDVEECFMSDIPGPIKHRITKPYDLNVFMKDEMSKRFGLENAQNHSFPSPTYAQIVRVASTLDEAMFLAGELAAGNKQLYPQFGRSFKKMEREWDRLPHNSEEARLQSLNVVTKAVDREFNGESMGVAK